MRKVDKTVLTLRFDDVFCLLFLYLKWYHIDKETGISILYLCVKYCTDWRSKSRKKISLSLACVYSINNKGIGKVSYGRHHFQMIMESLSAYVLDIWRVKFAYFFTKCPNQLTFYSLSGYLTYNPIYTFNIQIKKCLYTWP